MDCIRIRMVESFALEESTTESLASRMKLNGEMKMEKPKKVKSSKKLSKTGAQRDLERIRTLEDLVSSWTSSAEEQGSRANALQAEVRRASVTISGLMESNKRLNEINDSLNQQLHSLSRKETDLKISYHQPTQECVGESDPSGKSSHEPGAKLDSGKLRAGLVLRGFSNALKAVAEVGTFGANKYTDDGWRSVENGRKRYEDALWRHLLARGRDEQSGLPHAWHALWNMMALIELDLDSDPA